MSLIQETSNRKAIFSIALDPRTKILLLLSVSLSAVTINNLFFLLVLFEVIIYVSCIANINFKTLWQYLKPTIWVIIPLFLIQAFFAQDKTTALITIPWFNNNSFVLVSLESLKFATNITLRILILAYSSIFFSLVTNSQDFLQSLRKIGIPFEISFTAGLVIYFLPIIVSETAKVRDALETRGLSISTGKLRTRLKTFRILITALLLNFIEKARYQAIAMDSRGFKSSYKRTYFHKLNYRWIDWISLILILGLNGVIYWYFQYDIPIITFFKSL
ncbi:MAG: energy-coupling factor transporter transmembrane component T [Asgard group archaeon]|nr:energy-coupling factor transporter transmembrane component T [Asgard group archaeon]